GKAAAVDVRGDKTAVVGQERGDGGPDAGVAGRARRVALRRAVDAELVGAGAADAHHLVGAAEAHAEVAVGDAVIDRLGLALDRAQLLGELAEDLFHGCATVYVPRRGTQRSPHRRRQR